MYKPLLLAMLAGTVSFSALAAEKMTVYKSKYCGCCQSWNEHMEQNGFELEVIETEQLGAVKQQYGIAPELASCHTGIVNGYVIEGHVPAADVKKLIFGEIGGQKNHGIQNIDLNIAKNLGYLSESTLKKKGSYMLQPGDDLPF